MQFSVKWQMSLKDSVVKCCENVSMCFEMWEHFLSANKRW